ncbi:unnamed protein product [Heligmosomoides polygyrus]|uniref:Uncharacterized protein n=1 Tax=Heligmosomoides polygyrus TaxID=6339 RepID=A0A3P7XVD1_HELPZ|nr:unnamed protein product [Heligmosomoides polygyrus]
MRNPSPFSGPISPRLASSMYHGGSRGLSRRIRRVAVSDAVRRPLRARHSASEGPVGGRVADLLRFQDSELSFSAQVHHRRASAEQLLGAARFHVFSAARAESQSISRLFTME